MCRNRIYLRDARGEKIPLDEPDEDGQEYEWEWQDGCISRLDPTTGEPWWTIPIGMGTYEFLYPQSIRISSDGYAYIYWVEPWNYSNDTVDYRVQVYRPELESINKPYTISPSGSNYTAGPIQSFWEQYVRTDIVSGLRNGVMKVNAEGVVLWNLELLEPSPLRPTGGVFQGANINPFRGGDLDIKKDDDSVMWLGSQRDKNGVTLKRITQDGQVAARLRARDMWEHGLNHNGNAPGTTSCTQLRIDKHGNLYCLPLNTWFKRMVNGSPANFGPTSTGLKYINPNTGEILWHGVPHTASDGTVYGQKNTTEWNAKFPFGFNDQTAATRTAAFEYEWNEDTVYASTFYSALPHNQSPWGSYLSLPWMWRFKLTDYLNSARYWYPKSEPNEVFDCFLSPQPNLSPTQQLKWFFDIPFEVPLTTGTTDNPNFITTNVWWIHFCCNQCLFGLSCDWMGANSGQTPRGIVVDGASTVVLGCHTAKTHEITANFTLARSVGAPPFSCIVLKSDENATGYHMKCLAFDLIGGSATIVKCIEEDPYFFNNGGHHRYIANASHDIVYMTNGVDRLGDFIICHQSAIASVNTDVDETVYKEITNPDGTFDTLNMFPSFSLAHARSGVIWSVQMGWCHEIDNQGDLEDQPVYTGKKRPAQGLCGDIRTVDLDRETLEAERDTETEQFTEEDNGSGTDDGT